MKTGNFTRFVLILIAFLNCNSLFAVPQKDTTQVRYVKFSTSVDVNCNRIALHEIKAFSEGQNVAKNKMVTPNKMTYDYNTSFVTDDDVFTAWNSDNYLRLTGDGKYGPTDEDPHFIVVDLGTKYTLERIYLDLTGGWNFDYTFDLKVSEDSVNWFLVDSKVKSHGAYNYTSIPIPNIRYIKYACYYSSDNGQVNVQEIQAFVAGVNVALNKNVKANSHEGDNVIRAKDAVDGSISSRWSSNRNDHYVANRADSALVEVTVDFGTVNTIDSIALSYHSKTIFSLSISPDGVDWIEIDKRLNNNNEYTYPLQKPVTINSTIISISPSSVKCKAQIISDGGVKISARGFCWSTSPNPTILDNTTHNGSDIGSYFATITGLLNNTVYYIRPYATNADSTCYGKVQSFHFPLNIQTDVITNLSINSATTGGYVSNVGSIEVLGKGVCWSIDPFPTISNDTTLVGAGAGEFSSNLNLVDQSRYYVRAYAITNMGVFYGNEISFKYQSTQYLASDGFWSGEVFTETSPDFFQSPSGSYLFNNGYEWTISDWITSGDPGNPPLTGWWDGTVLIPIPHENATVSYDKNRLTESVFNDGSFDETLVITHDFVNGASFNGVPGEDFIETGKAYVRNLPVGISAKLKCNSNLSLTLYLIGYTTANASKDSLSNVKIMLLPSAFSNGSNEMTNGTLKLLSLYFIEPTTISVTGVKTNSDYSISTDKNVELQNNSDFTVNNNTEMNLLVVNPGANLTVKNSLSVNNVILKADETNSFSVKLESPITVSGDVIYQKTIADGHWYYFSFPYNIDIQDISMREGGTINNDWYLFSYNGDKRAKNGSAANWDSISSGTLIANKGYALILKEGSETKTMQFILNKSVTSIETSKDIPTEYYDGSLGIHHKGWNLIGQPYLRHYNGSNLGIHYITRWDGDRYQGLLSSKVNNLAPFEAFFVQVPSSCSITFCSTNRVSAPQKISALTDETIQLNMSSNSGTDFTTLLLNTSYSASYIIGEDLEKMVSTTSTKPQLYSEFGGVNYTYNALAIGDVVNLPIGYYSKLGGASSISASDVTATDLSHLLLIDTELGVTTDLLTASYNFDAEVGTNNTRFVLTAQRLATNVVSPENENNPYVYSSKSVLYIKNIPHHASINVTDVLGRVIYSNINTTMHEIEIPINNATVYLVRMVSDNSVWSWKVW